MDREEVVVGVLEAEVDQSLTGLTRDQKEKSVHLTMAFGLVQDVRMNTTTTVDVVTNISVVSVMRNQD